MYLMNLRNKGEDLKELCVSGHREKPCCKRRGMGGGVLYIYSIYYIVYKTCNASSFPWCWCLQNSRDVDPVPLCSLLPWPDYGKESSSGQLMYLFLSVWLL